MDNYRNNFITQLSKDVDEGLSASSKFLKSKYFYDSRGDLLFRSITRLPEYYLTACETEILRDQGEAIFQRIPRSEKLNMIEFGPGDGSKAKLLLEAAARLRLNVNYYPVDISPDALSLTQKNTAALAPVHTVTGDYAQVLGNDIFRKLSSKFILFLGSNIGNFNREETASFMKYLAGNMSAGEHVLIGFDLIKDKDVVLAAYNDPTGMTSDFNLNLLTMLNRELGADFDTANFFHAPVYDSTLNAAKSYLVSNKQHQVFFKKLNKHFSFSKGEEIYTEISCKYSEDDVRDIAQSAGFEVTAKQFDKKRYFLNALLRKV